MTSYQQNPKQQRRPMLVLFIRAFHKGSTGILLKCCRAAVEKAACEATRAADSCLMKQLPAKARAT